MSILLKLSDAAQILGVHPRTLRSWSDRGHIPYLQTPGGHRRFRKNDLQNFVQKIEHGGKQNRGLMKAARTAVKQAIQSPKNNSSYHLPPALKKLTENKTTVVIAHRLSTIQNSNKIFVIDNGQVVSTGTHNELLNSSNIYNNFYNKQIKNN